MGRYDFRPTRVLQTAKQQFAARRIATPPLWLQAVGENPPPQILVRTQPIQHTGYGKQRSNRKLRKQFTPQRITYPEDDMRKMFFTDHPWELARPRILVEGIKMDGGEDWGRVRPEGLALQGENVIRRQLWLIEHEKQDPLTAYNTARREFYRERLREDIERKVAKEEAMHMGAYFRKSTIAWGMELEDRKFHGFKEWANRRLLVVENARQSMVMGVDDVSMIGSGSPGETDAADPEASANELIEKESEEGGQSTDSPQQRRRNNSSRSSAPDRATGFDTPAESDNFSLRI